MAYSEHLVERVRRYMPKASTVTGKKMMGGYLFMVDDKMCVGIDTDKKTGEDRLMARIGEEAQKTALKKKGCREMDFTGRPMKGFVFIYPEGTDKEKDLEYWVQLALKYVKTVEVKKKKQ